MVRAADSILINMMRINETAPRPRGNQDATAWEERSATRSGLRRERDNRPTNGSSLENPSTPSPNGDTEKTKRPRIGLALSAGGARGLAHVGVIQVLEENGIKIDCLAGTSMGAYVGACWWRGHDGKSLGKIALSHRGRYGPWKLMDLAWPFQRGLVGGNKMESSLRQEIGDLNFNQLDRPFAVSATRFDNLEPTIFSSGDIASAVRASCSMPGICVPATRGKLEYIDGGVTDPLAIRALHSLGVDRVITCCALRDPRHKRITLRRKRLKYTRLRSFARLLNVKLNPFARGNVYDIVMRAIEAAQHRVMERDLLEADVVIRPSTTRLRWYAFHEPERYVEAGRRATEKRLDAIKALIETPVKKRRSS